MIYTLIDLVQMASRVLSILIIARAVLSWFGPKAKNPLVGFVHRTTEPLLAPVRKLLPSMGGVDFSPMIVLIGLLVAERIIVRVLAGMA